VNVPVQVPVVSQPSPHHPPLCISLDPDYDNIAPPVIDRRILCDTREAAKSLARSKQSNPYDMPVLVHPHDDIRYHHYHPAHHEIVRENGQRFNLHICFPGSPHDSETSSLRSEYIAYD
jgi:hypothetical protein